MNMCGVCAHAEQSKAFVAREMMFGYRDEFQYFECSNCGCVQITSVPENLGKYYPSHYYSFQTHAEARDRQGTSLKERFVMRNITTHRLGSASILGKFLEQRHSYVNFPPWLKDVNLNLKLNSKILDVGCGAGHLLLDLRKLRFSNLLGVDPYIDSSIDYGRGLKIVKGAVETLDGPFDFIMLHHSFEHMPEPLKVFKNLYGLLRRKRYALIRIPVAGSFAWRKYGVNWVQLDAPRHLFLHTQKSIRMMARAVGFDCAKVTFDSTEFQFWGSEQYVKDIALTMPDSLSIDAPKALFTQLQIDEFATMAKELNQNGDGDQACFYLYKD